MRRLNRLPPKLEAVLVAIAKDHGLNVTQAVKIPYLVDVVARRVLGRPITEGVHETWQLGVVTRQAWHHLDKSAQGKSPFRVKQVICSEEKRVSVVDETDVADLTDDERQVVAFVWDQFKSTSAAELGRITKRMNPNKKSWGSNELADTGEDAYDRMSANYQEMAALVESLTPAQMQDWVKVEDIEEAIA
jgi:uncharacterized phage-associated protein